MDFKIKVVIINFLLIFVLINVVKSEEIEKVNIICETTKKVNHHGVRFLAYFTGSDTKVLTQNAVVNKEFKNELIEGIYFESSSQIHFIPKGLKETYPKLKVLSFSDQPLKTMSEDDLEQFGNDLEQLIVLESNITFLTRNLFIHNPNLRVIVFSAYPLKFIEPGFIKNTNKMKQLQMLVISGYCIREHRVGPKIHSAPWTHDCNDRSAMPQYQLER